jgi:hypothetical protein
LTFTAILQRRDSPSVATKHLRDFEMGEHRSLGAPTISVVVGCLDVLNVEIDTRVRIRKAHSGSWRGLAPCRGGVSDLKQTN